VPRLDGETPTWVASFAGHVEVVRVLAAQGADLNAPSDGGWTPMDVASCEVVKRRCASAISDSESEDGVQ
jgi:hypothetical protein